jgi:hypothetical protein
MDQPTRRALQHSFVARRGMTQREMGNLPPQEADSVCGGLLDARRRCQEEIAALTSRTSSAGFTRVAHGAVRAFWGVPTFGREFRMRGQALQ